MQGAWNIFDISFLDNIELQKPVADVDRIKKQRSKFLTKDELKDLLSQLDTINHHVSLLCEFQSLTGLRFGEMVALRTQDFDIENAEIDVNATYLIVAFLTLLCDFHQRMFILFVRWKLDARAVQIINHFDNHNQGDYGNLNLLT